MFSFRWFHAPKSRSRQWFACVALVGYVASVTGFPLPTPSRVGDRSVAFPCQQHQCGCNSAAQCWDDCCCYSLAERVAWARQSNVELPVAVQLAWAHAQYRADQSPATQLDSAERHGDDQLADACCEPADTQPPVPTKKNCSHCVSDDAYESAEQAAAPIKLRWVQGWQAQKCRGLSTLWVACGGCLPMPPGPQWDFNWVVCGQLGPMTICCASHLTPPPVPPPCV